MGASFLVRFDDICPTMNWDVWRQVEDILTSAEGKPILAVVPDNHDAVLNVAPPNPKFWDEVRRWQAMGWTIALHGYRHLPETTCSGIIGLNSKSEFAGLPYEAQLAKITAGMTVFKNQGISSRVWVAPSHSFDANTVAALRTVGIDRISDGLFVYPHTDRNGTLWTPQQIWRFHAMPLGVWTVCCHINSWSAQSLECFRRGIDRYKNSIISMEDAATAFGKREESAFDTLLSRLILQSIRIKRGTTAVLHRGLG